MRTFEATLVRDETIDGSKKVVTVTQSVHAAEDLISNEAVVGMAIVIVLPARHECAQRVVPEIHLHCMLHLRPFVLRERAALPKRGRRLWERRTKKADVPIRYRTAIDLARKLDRSKRIAARKGMPGSMRRRRDEHRAGDRAGEVRQCPSQRLASGISPMRHRDAVASGQQPLGHVRIVETEKLQCRGEQHRRMLQADQEQGPRCAVAKGAHRRREKKRK